MHLIALSLENFRNVEAARLSFVGSRLFLIGANGQGKSNLLEAVGFSNALRSFRASKADGLVRCGETEARIFYRFRDSGDMESDVLVRIPSNGTKAVEVDGEKITRFGDFVGRFPSIALSSRDLQLTCDGPGGRRRWLDLALSSASPAYLKALRAYHRGLRGRNHLLRQGGGVAELHAFETGMAPVATEIIRSRHEALVMLSDRLGKAYATLSAGKEEASLRYRPDLDQSDPSQMTVRLEADREGDRLAGATRHGPHRDDFLFELDGNDARHMASEGQRRSLVLALRLAEFAHLREARGTTPLLLADDVLGELDDERKSNFRRLLPEDAQVFATGTRHPSDAADPDDWETFQVKAGSFEKAEAPSATT